MKFQVGDRVKWHEHTGEIIWIDNEHFATKWNDDLGQTQDKIGFMSQLQLISRKGEGMSRYDELKARIEKVEGWTKEADDILQEMIEDGKGTPEFTIKAWSGTSHIVVDINTWDGHYGTPKKEFSYHSQCSKNTAFKQALMWLLDNSSINKDDTSEKIAELVRKLQELTAEIEKLRGEV